MIKKLISSIFKIFALASLGLAQANAQTTTAGILPLAKTQFLDQNGNPLSSGKVYFYSPGTTTAKTTWSDINKSIPNTNPINLDAGGRAIVWGDGSYRQQVYDRSNNLIWDQTTAISGTTSSSPSVGDGLAVGTISPYSGLIPPPNYQLAYGQAISRSTYPELMSAITYSTSITCTGSSAVINVSDTSNLSVGSVLESVCIAGSPTIISKTSSSVTMSGNSTLSITTTGLFFIYGNGDGSTTFNVPDLRGYVIAGRCNMGGVNCSNLTTYFDTSNASNVAIGLGAKGGSQSKTLVTANLPPYTPAGTVSVTSSANVFTASTLSSLISGGTGSNFQAPPSGGGIGSVTSTGTLTGTAQGGTSTAFSAVQSTQTLNYIIKVTPDTSVSTAVCANLQNAGTACTYNVGTSGATIPLLNTANTWSLNQTLASVTIASGSFTGLPNPTNATDAANKAYVDSVAGGLNVLASSALATAAVLPNTPTYSNGTLGVGATLTAGSNTTLTVDSTAAPLNTVILVKNQVSTFQNGIYTVTQAGSGSVPWILTRATYFDQAAEMKLGSYTLVTAGSSNGGNGYILQAAVTTVGTDPVTFIQFSSGSNVQLSGNNGWSGTNSYSNTTTFNGSTSFTSTNQMQGATYFGGKPWFDVMSNANGCVAADPTGVSDSYTAIQCKINYLNSTYGGGVVYVSPGQYLVSQYLHMSQGIWLIGASIDSSSITVNTNSRVLWFYINNGTANCPSGGLNGGIDKLSIYGYQNASATTPAIDVGGNCVANIYNSRVWFGSYGLRTAGADGMCLNSFIAGYTGNVYSSGANWYVRCKLDSISSGVIPSTYGFIQGANDPLVGIAENYFDMVDLSVNGAAYSLYYDDASNNGYVKFTNSIFDKAVFINHVHAMTHVGSTFGSTVVINAGSMSISGSVGTVAVTVSGAGGRVCAANISIAC